MSPMSPVTPSDIGEEHDIDDENEQQAESNDEEMPQVADNSDVEIENISDDDE